MTATTSRKWALGLAAIGFTVMLTLALIEVGLQLVNYPAPKTSHQRFFVEHDEQRGWRNIPNAEGTFISAEYNIRLHYNNRGFRGLERPYQKPPNVYRIVVLGDSYIDGYSVAQEDRVTERLEHALNANQNLKEIEVIALGAAGYSTDQELLWLQSEGLRYQPDLVVLMFYYNDIWYNAQPRYWRGAKPLFVEDNGTLRLTNVPVPDLRARRNRDAATQSRSFLGRFKAWCRTHVKLYMLALRSIENTPWLQKAAVRAGLASSPAKDMMTLEGRTPLLQELSVFRRTPSSKVDEAWRITTRLLQQMHATATAHNAQFIGFYIPFRYSIYPTEWTQREEAQSLAPDDWDLHEPRRRFLAGCAQEIVCLDPTERFLTEAATLSEQHERLYYHYDYHWNPQGHALAAQILTEHILSQTLITQAARSTNAMQNE